MVIGAHVVLYSADAEADRAFFRDVLGYSFVDAGQGWLIFQLPPAELAIHPASSNGTHELFLMCDDIAAFADEMSARGVSCSALHAERWGKIIRVDLPSGATIGVYEPTHPSPLTSA